MRDQQALTERSMKGQSSHKRSHSGWKEQTKYSPIKMKLTIGRSEIIE